MHEFKADDRIRALHSTRSWGGETLGRGDVLIVGDEEVGLDDGDGFTLIAGPPESPNQYLVNPEDFELVPAPLDPSKEVAAPSATEATRLDPGAVKAGDTVTLERNGAAHTDKVTGINTFENATAPFWRFGMENTPDPLEHGVFYVVGPGGWTLTAHQPAPEPEPEWKAGMFADIVRLDDDAILRAVRVAAGVGASGHAWQTIPGSAWHEDDEVESVRPLVVVDPDGAMEKVAEVLRSSMGGAVEAWFDHADRIVRALGIEVS